MKKWVLIAGLFTSSLSYGATFSFVQGTSANANTTSVAKAFTSNVTAGNLILVGCVDSVSNAPLSASDNVGDIFTVAGTSLTIATRTMEVFYSSNAVGGATTITCTDTGATATFVQISIHEYTGTTNVTFDVASSSFPSANIAGATSVISNFMTTKGSNELIFNFASPLASAPTGGSGTERQEFSNNVTQASQDIILSLPQIYQSTFTLTSFTGRAGSIQAGFCPGACIGIPAGSSTVTPNTPSGGLIGCGLLGNCGLLRSN